MASAETAELRARTDEQLLSDLHEAHQALFNLRFQAATLALADVSQVRKARRRVARIHTLLRERDILEELDAELREAGVDTAPAPAAEAEAEEPEAVEEMADEASNDEAAADDEAADEAADDETTDDEETVDDGDEDDADDDAERED